MFNTPVAIFTFNRPHLTERLIGILAHIKPSRILVVSDGPRPNVPGDAEKCAAVRRLFDHLEWECQVDRNFAASNMGSFPRNASGLNWVFEQAEEAIILEDDCVPDLSFFPYCEELLEKYREDSRIGLISGNNFLNSKYQHGLPSYFFSIYATTWGWASWRRTWEKVEINMPYWPEFRNSGALGLTVCNLEEEEYWRIIYDEIQAKKRKNAWDYQLILTCMRFKLLTIVPAVNLVSNVGFGSDATNCLDINSPLSNVSAHNLPLPLRHPNREESSTKVDKLIFDIRFGNSRRHLLSKHMPRLNKILHKMQHSFSLVYCIKLVRSVVSKLLVPFK